MQNKGSDAVPRRPFSVRVYEAKLTVNVARFGDMRVRAEVTHGDQTWTTQVAAGDSQCPNWEECFHFLLDSEATVTVRVVHCPYFLPPVLIGACCTPVVFRRKRSGWWELLNAEKQPVGSVRLGFDTDDMLGWEDECQQLSDKVHEMKNYLELEREELDYLKLKYKLKAEKLHQEQRRNLSRVQTLTAPPRGELQTSHIDDFDRRKKSIALREDLLLLEQRRLGQGIAELENEKEEIQRLRDEVLCERAKLQIERRNLAFSRYDQRPLRVSMSHDTIPGLSVNLQEQWEKLRGIRYTLVQNESALQSEIQEVKATRSDVDKMRRALATRCEMLAARKMTN